MISRPPWSFCLGWFGYNLTEELGFAENLVVADRIMEKPAKPKWKIPYENSASFARFGTEIQDTAEQKEKTNCLSKPKNLKTSTTFIARSVHFESWIFHKRAVSFEVFTFQSWMFDNHMVSIVVFFWSTRHYNKAITMGWNLIWMGILIYYSVAVSQINVFSMQS